MPNYIKKLYIIVILNTFLNKLNLVKIKVQPNSLQISVY